MLKTNKKDSYKANFQYTVPPLSSFYGMKKINPYYNQKRLSFC